MSTKKTNVKFEVLEIVSDRQQYKPYTARLSGSGKVFVEVAVDDDRVTIHKDGTATLSVDGLVEVMMVVADTIETAHEKYRTKKYGH